MIQATLEKSTNKNRSQAKKGSDANGALRNQLVVAQAQIDAVSQAFAVIEFEPDGTIVTANENFLSTLGYTLAEIEGKHHRTFVDAKYAQSPEYREFWARLGRGESQTGEFLRVAKGGRQVWIQARYSAILDERGHVAKVVKYATDITEAVRLRADGAQKTAIVENAPINIMLADLDGTIVYMNPASRNTLKTIERQLPVKVDDIVGGSYDVFHKMPAHQRKLLADPRNLPHNTEIQVGDDTLYLTASAIYDADGKYAGPMVAWEVITDKKESERRERENQERERKTQEELRHKVDQLLVAVNAAAEGDLTQPITVTGDDAVGELAQGLRRMIADLRDVISQVVE
ncbi:MAG: PAS domain-containing protein, partial [Planctomycetales bacterium]|nr:PAS domain-containing protein [Planctomycetales bacterium]